LTATESHTEILVISSLGILGYWSIEFKNISRDLRCRPYNILVLRYQCVIDTQPMKMVALHLR